MSTPTPPPSDPAPPPTPPVAAGVYYAPNPAGTAYPVYVAPQSSGHRITWPVAGIVIAVLGLIAALIVALSGGRSSSYADSSYEEGYSAGLEDGYGDYPGEDYGSYQSFDPANPDDQALAIEMLLDMSGIDQLTDVCINYSYSSIDIGGSTASDPDLITYWVFDGYSPYETVSIPEINDVRFGPDDFDLGLLASNEEALDPAYAAGSAGLAMSCVTTEHGDPAPLGAYYFYDLVYPDYDPVVYVDLATFAVVDD